MTPPARFLSVLVALLLLTYGVTLAKTNNPNVTLQYLPQQSVGGADVAVDSAMRKHPVILEIGDGLGLDDPEVLGTRTDDADRVHQLTATDDTIDFVRDTVEQIFQDWGISTTGESNRKLAIELLTYRIEESNKAVGATYHATVRVKYRLWREGRDAYEGQATGDASRYGKKFSNTNVNEVLSDALLEAVADLISDQSLQLVWVAGASAEEADDPSETGLQENASGSRVRVSPDELLDELKRLIEGHLETETIIKYLERRALNRPLNSDDLIAFKKADVSEEILRAVIELPVTSQ
jgi:hypothetical protein